MFKEYTNSIYGAVVVCLAQVAVIGAASGNGTKITFDSGQSIDVTDAYADVKADLPAADFVVLNASATSELFIRKEAVNTVYVTAGKAQVRLEGGAVLNVTESYDDVKTALGV